MNELKTITTLLVDLLDLENDRIGPQSYLVRDLGMESIDFLELAVSLNSAFQVPVADDVVFLRNLRLFIVQAEEAGEDIAACLQTHYPFLSGRRIAQMANDLAAGPVLQVRDLVAYVRFQTHANKAA